MEGNQNGRSVVLPILAAVGTGIGVLGFVTFFGGAILWVRFDAAGLPANEAVAVLPKGVLVTMGAGFLVPAVLLALLAVGALLLIDLVLQARHLFATRRQTAQAAGLARAAGTERQKAQVLHRSAKLSREADEVRAAASAPEADEEEVRRRTRPSDETQTAEVRAREASERAARLAAQAEAAKAGTIVEAPTTLDELSGYTRVVATTIFLISLFCIEVLVVVSPSSLGSIGLVHSLLLILIGGAALAISWLVFRDTGRLLWFGLAIFLSVGVFIGAATYFRTRARPKIEPAAALRKGGGPITGFFVAESSDHLYLGVSGRRPDSRDGRLRVLGKSEIVELAVGPLQSPGPAERRAALLALRLCRNGDLGPPAGGAGARRERGARSSGGFCSKHELTALRRRARGRQTGSG